MSEQSKPVIDDAAGIPSIDVKLEQTFDRLRSLTTNDMPRALAMISGELSAIAAEMQPLSYLLFDLDLASGRLKLHACRLNERPVTAS